VCMIPQYDFSEDSVEAVRIQPVLLGAEPGSQDSR
jgi:hypothetical protein